MEDRRNVGENSCNSGDGTDQRVQSLMFMMMIMMMMMIMIMIMMVMTHSVKMRMPDSGEKNGI